jgi:hypothetical protein
MFAAMLEIQQLLGLGGYLSPTHGFVQPGIVGSGRATSLTDVVTLPMPPMNRANPLPDPPLAPEDEAGFSGR